MKQKPDKNSPPFQGGVPAAGGGGGLHNLPKLKTFRKTLRNHLTPAEATLWNLLKNKQLDGRKFRRQHSVGNYVIDFYCPAEKLAVELDGEGHNGVARSKKDQQKDLFLRQAGILVLRFENQVVCNHPEGLLAQIKQHFSRHQEPPRPSGAPP